MLARIVGCSFVVAMVAVAAVPPAAAQWVPVDPYGGASYGGASYGGASYGGASYGGASYGGMSDGGAPVLGDGAPAILAFDWTTGLVRFDERGRRVVVAAPTEGPVLAHAYQPVLVDEASGRWAITRQAKGAAKRAWAVMIGDAGGATGEFAGDPTCGGSGPACFEVLTAFTPDRGGVLALALHAAGFTLARYDLATGAREQLAGKAIANRLALAATHDRAAYVSRGGLTLVDWTARGPRPKARTRRVKVSGELDRLVLLDDAVLVRRRVVGRGRRVAITVEVIDPASGDREVVYRPRHELPWAPVEAPARGSAFVHDCDFTRGDNPCDVVEATSVGARVMVRGVARALDVSADGRYLLVRRDPRARAGRATAWPDLVVIELSTGREVRVVTETPIDSAQFTR